MAACWAAVAGLPFWSTTAVTVTTAARSVTAALTHPRLHKNVDDTFDIMVYVCVIVGRSHPLCQ